MEGSPQLPDFTGRHDWELRFIKNVQQKSNAMQKEKIAVNSLERKKISKKSLQQVRLCIIAENTKEAKRHKMNF